MGTSDRRERHRASLRREILDAATQVFVEEGFERLTMRRLAERIEYSPTTIYLYFKDKHELLETICEETFSQLAARLERLQETAGSPLQRLRESLRTYVEFGLAHQHQYTVAFLSPGPGLGQRYGQRSMAGRTLDTLRRALRTCVDSGELNVPDVELAAHALWAAAHGVTSLLITMEGPTLVNQAPLVDHTIDTLLTGLKAPAVPRRILPGPRRPRADFFD